MATRYADIVDPEVIEETIPDDYANDAVLVRSGVVGMETDTVEGTQASWIKETLFETDDEGQAIGIDGEITLRDKSQTKYQIPLFYRADGALLDDLEGEITSKRRRSAALSASNAIQRKAIQMQDAVSIHTLEGCGLSLVAAAENYYDTVAAAVTLKLMQRVKSTRGDRGGFLNGILVMRSLMFHYLNSLGLVANDSNTMTDRKRTEVLERGFLGNILGMDIIMTDKLSLAGDGDYYTYFLEDGALRIKTSGLAPNIDPIIRAERNFQDIIKFRTKMGSGLVGMSWGAVASDVVTNDDLATAANWSRAKTYAKDVPIAIMRSPVPTITA